MDISVLGVDLGKNVCSVVGLDASGAGILAHAPQGKARDPNCSGGKAPLRALSGWRPVAGLIISAACSPPADTMSG